jgi:Zn finger protein HypA/HybF involved in hydrogenase expression
MSLIYKQAPVSLLEKANELKEYKSVNLNPTIFKHLLKCTSCLWKLTFYESTGSSIPIDSKKMRCPACKEKEMDSTKIKIIS